MIEDDTKYQSALESVRAWNTKMMTDRKMRQPYLDSATGLAQGSCHLWASPLDRQPGLKEGQVYSYPRRKWRKKKKAIPPVSMMQQAAPSVAPIGSASTDALETMAGEIMDPVVSLNRPAPDVSKDKWYSSGPNYEELDDFEDFDDLDDPYGEDSDYEDFGSRKKKQKKNSAGGGTGGGGGRGRRARNDDCDKPFACELCTSRYKAKQGLDYHMAHAHKNMNDTVRASTPSSLSYATNSLSSAPSITVPASAAPTRPDNSMNDSLDSCTSATSKSKSKNPVRNDYCDFCLGDASMNKRSKVPEEMVSCADCGRSGHPTCLQFTDNMKISVRKYPWQCLECKSCGLCGTSENDAQLLFCDDCDRGYHMYCLKPPLSEPPEGNWSCHLCIKEFHNGVKPDWMS